MFDFDVQVGDKMWAELNKNEDPMPPNDTKDNALVYVGDQKKNDDEGATVPGLTERTSDGPTEHPASEKQPAPEASGHYSATRLDMESWPDLPSLTTTLDRNDNIASSYLDFSSVPSLHKVTGIASGLLHLIYSSAFAFKESATHA